MTTTLKLGGADGAHIVSPVVPPGEGESPQFLPPAESLSLPGFETIDAGMPSGYGDVSSVERSPQTGEDTVRLNNSFGSQ